MIKNLEGLRFGRLLVIKKSVIDVNQKTSWCCQCDCGNVKDIPEYSLIRNTRPTLSCGCLHKEAVTKHGYRHMPEYNIWRGMMDRCYNQKNANYFRYGGRGIVMSNEWRENFEAFYKDMGPRPGPEYSIERIENDKGYYKGNCKWATKKEQANNRGNSKQYIYRGKSQNLEDWCKELGLNFNTIYSRISKGWSFKHAITISVNEHLVSRYTYNDRDMTLHEWCAELGLNYPTIWYRIKKGMSFEEAITKPTRISYEHKGETKNLAEWCRILDLKYSTIQDRLNRGIPFDKAIVV